MVVAFGIGMAIGMAGSNQVTKFIERDLVFTRSLLSAAAALFLLAAMPSFALAAVVTVWLGLFCGLAWVSGYTLLQENVEDEFRGRTFASLTVLSRLGLFASLTFFPILSSAYDAAVHAEPTGFVLSGTRVALWVAGVLVLIAGLNTRRLLGRFRLSRPQPLALVPKLKRPPATGLFIAFEGVEGAGQGHADPDGGGAHPLARTGRLVTREPGGTELGEQIRQVLLDPKTGSSTPAPRRCCSRRAARRRSRRSSARRSPTGRPSCRIATSTRRSPTRGGRAAWASRTSSR